MPTKINIYINIEVDANLGAQGVQGWQGSELPRKDSVLVLRQEHVPAHRAELLEDTRYKSTPTPNVKSHAEHPII